MKRGKKGGGVGGLRFDRRLSCVSPTAPCFYLRADQDGRVDLGQAHVEDLKDEVARAARRDHRERLAAADFERFEGRTSASRGGS